MNPATIEQRFAGSPSSNGAPSTAGAGAPPLDLARVPVLVIEDEAMIAWFMETLLEEMGFESISLASSAAEAIAAAKQTAPELIISDINLGPGSDGVEAVGTICGTCRPAVVFVSAYVDGDARSRIAQHIPDARILSKPLNAGAMATAVREALGPDLAH